ncbi:MAG: holo-ACP synthase [Opitutaceae bacterium]|nr:holo-ACP synthase [Cytophagales bacterium]
MIYGIGTDIVSVLRLQEKIEKVEFVNLVFSANEQTYCNLKAKPAESFAARFAAKEAFLKALKSGMYATFNLSQIEVINDKNGCPYITLSEELRVISAKLIGTDNFKVHVSLSHTSEYATANVVIEIV